MKRMDLILEIYKDSRSVFTLRDIAMLAEESNYSNLKQKIIYYVRKASLFNIRRGIYVKESFNPEELACKIYTPAYISVEYVLQKEGIIFQYDERLTPVSYLSRIIDVGEYTIVYRKIKGEVLLNLSGILRKENGVNIATPERAFLDMLYLSKQYHFDNLSGLDPQKVLKILPIYRSKRMAEQVRRLFGTS